MFRRTQGFEFGDEALGDDPFAAEPHTDPADSEPGPADATISATPDLAASQAVDVEEPSVAVETAQLSGGEDVADDARQPVPVAPPVAHAPPRASRARAWLRRDRRRIGIATAAGLLLALGVVRSLAPSHDEPHKAALPPVPTTTAPEPAPRAEPRRPKRRPRPHRRPRPARRQQPAEPAAPVAPTPPSEPVAVAPAPTYTAPPATAGPVPAAPSGVQEFGYEQ